MTTVHMQPARLAKPGRTEVRKLFSKSSSVSVWLARAVLVAAWLCLWQFLPDISVVRRSSSIFDPFFISSPSDVTSRLWAVCTGHDPTVFIWPYVGDTVEAALLGTAIGTFLGATIGLLLSNMPYVNRVVQPFVVALNAVPRIALIPMIVIITGPNFLSSVITCILVVGFIVFYNAFEGGSSVAPHVVQNATLLGARPASILWRVRWPMVLAWTFAALPNAVSMGLVSVITTEVLTGDKGLGEVLVTSLSLADATLTLCVVIVMAVTGMLLVGLTALAKQRLLHWWVSGER
jgi:NitT/TauT family transport system permease protein